MGSKRPLMSLCLAILATAALLLAPTVVIAQVIPPGVDLFETPGNGQTFVGLEIPAGFFDPNSMPFQEDVELKGQPFNTKFSSADTKVQRPFQAILNGPGSSATIPIQITGLRLDSFFDIFVELNDGSFQAWNLHVSLSTQQQQPFGRMQIHQTDRDGGTFNSFLPVLARLKFVRNCDGAVRVIDPAQNVFTAQDVPWQFHTPPPFAGPPGFCASCGPGCTRVLTVEESMLAAHGVLPALKTPPDP